MNNIWVAGCGINLYKFIHYEHVLDGRYKYVINYYEQIGPYVNASYTGHVLHKFSFGRGPYITQNILRIIYSYGGYLNIDHFA